MNDLWPIDSIWTSARHRTELDLTELIKSIDQVGLITAITIKPDGMLLAGGRRLEAMKALNKTEVPCHVVDTLDDALLELMIERDENTARKEMLPSELASLMRGIWDLEALKAHKTQLGNLVQKPRSTRGAENRASGKKIETRDRVGDALGLSGRKVDAIHRADVIARDESRSQAERQIAMEALADMDRTGQIYGAEEHMRHRLKALAEGSAPPRKPKPGSVRAANPAASLTKFAQIIENHRDEVEMLVGLDADVRGLPESQRLDWVKRLRFGRAAITRLIRHLEG